MWDTLQEGPKAHIKNHRAMPVHFSYTASFLVKQPILFAARLQKASDSFVANFIWMVNIRCCIFAAMSAAELWQSCHKVAKDFATGMFFGKGNQVRFTVHLFIFLQV